MKAICIDSKTRIHECDLIEGEPYEVLSENGCGEGCCYKVQKDGQGVWKKDRVIPLSDIDETECVNEKEVVYG